MAQVSISELVDMLQARRSGRGWLARCPAHDDKSPSLAISISEQGQVLMHCFAGCPYGAVQQAIGRLAGCQDGVPQAQPATNVNVKSQRSMTSDQDRTKRALQIWQEARPTNGTKVESYLQARALAVEVPERLRFHPRLKHPSGKAWPCMLALVTDGESDKPIGIHRTFLAIDGKAKAPVAPTKMMLGVCRGGAVRLSPPKNPLLIGEGIETTLSAMQATGFAGWAALSAAGLGTLVLPLIIDDVVVLSDGDDTGRRVSLDAAQRWRRQGRKVRIAYAPDGTDFNDLLRSGSAYGVVP